MLPGRARREKFSVSTSLRGRLKWSFQLEGVEQKFDKGFSFSKRLIKKGIDNSLVDPLSQSYIISPFYHAKS